MIPRVRRHLSGSGLGAIFLKALIGSAGLRLTGMAFGFLAGVQLARGLGADGYGIYGLAMSIIALLTVPTEFGIPQLLTREVAASQAENNVPKLRGVLRWATRASILLSVAIAALMTAWLALSGAGPSSALGMTVLVGLLMVPVVAQANIRSAALRGLQHIVKGQLPDALIRPAIFSLLLFLAPLLIAPLEPALAMSLGVASAATSLLIATWLLRRELPPLPVPTDTIESSRSWWRSAFPMALTEGMRVLQSHLVILILGLMSTAAAVGIFRVASSVALLMAVPLTIFSLVSAPIISRLYAGSDRSQLQPLLGWVAIGMTGSVAVIATPFLFAGDLIIGSIFGDEYSEAGGALSILSLGVIANGCFGANSILLNMTGHQNRVTRASAFSLLILCMTLPALIHLAGINGAAVASSFALTTWNLLMWRDALKFLSLDTSVGAFLRPRLNR